MSAAGVYLHIPFCRSRCSYCDFATGLFEPDLSARYVRAVVKEIQASPVLQNPPPVDTIYFGGGTPSLLLPRQVETLLLAVETAFRVDSRVEITMEMNPGKLSLGVLKDFQSLGVNRASFGAQTFDDGELARLGRSHNTADTLQTFFDLRKAGFENVSFDLIAGLPGQTFSSWKKNVEQALTLRPEHLSFYLLEVHEGTPLAEHIRRGIQPRPDDDLAAEMYRNMLERAEVAGYQHYEISNLCLQGFSSRHNTKYWTGAPYFGFGCSAHSYDGNNRRWANERDINRYVQLVEKGSLAIASEQLLSGEDMRAEAVFLGMRLMNGLNARRYQDMFGVDLRSTYEKEIAQFVDAGLVEVEGDLLRLTRSGALMSNEVFAAFV